MIDDSTRPADSYALYWTEEEWREHVKRGEWKPGRYNETGERVLYLSEEESTAFAECDSREQTVFTQRFELCLRDVASVYLSFEIEQEFPFLNTLLLNCEVRVDPLRVVDALRVKDPYRATHFLSYLCRMFRIDALRFPSVQDQRKFNLVLFRRAVCQAETMMIGQPQEYSRNR